MFVNGKLMGTASGRSDLGSLDLMKNSHAVYDIGLKRDSVERFHGYIRDLHVFRKALTQEEMTFVRG